MTNKLVVGGNGGFGSNHYRVFEMLYNPATAEYRNLENFPALFKSLQTGECPEIIAAVSNSIIGPIPEVKKLMEDLEADGTVLKEKNSHNIDIHHALIAGPAATSKTIKKVFSYIAALNQCRKNIEVLGLQPVEHRDTWDAAVDVIGRNDPEEAAIAPIEAAEKLRGQVLKDQMSDVVPNKTFFKVFSLG